MRTRDVGSRAPSRAVGDARVCDVEARADVSVPALPIVLLFVLVAVPVPILVAMVIMALLSPLVMPLGSDLKSKMDKAVSQQHYAEAEQYRVRLEELAEEKALAAEKEQHVSPKDSLGKVRIVIVILLVLLVRGEASSIIDFLGEVGHNYLYVVFVRARQAAGRGKPSLPT